MKKDVQMVKKNIEQKIKKDELAKKEKRNYGKKILLL